jgi:hypothetical protein
MKFEPEPYQCLFTWTIAFSILEPFVALVSYLLSVRYGMKTMYQLYPHTSPILIVVAEYDNCICQSHVFL